MLTLEILQKQRTPADLRAFVLSHIAASKTDREELRKAFLKNDLYKNFVEEIIPIARCAERLYPPNFTIEPVVGSQGFDARVYDESGRCVEKIEVTMPHDGDAESKDARLVLSRGMGLVQSMATDSLEKLAAICVATCRQKASKDYSDCTLLICLNWVECALLSDEEHDDFIDTIHKDISLLPFRAKRVLLYDSTIARIAEVSGRGDR